MMLAAGPGASAAQQPRPADGTAADPPIVVHRVAARQAAGRTEVLVLGRGIRNRSLSEPFLGPDGARFYIWLDNARLALFVPPSQSAAGAVKRLVAIQEENSVRVVVEVNPLDRYGVRVSRDTLLLWLRPSAPVRRAGVRRAATSRAGGR